VKTNDVYFTPPCSIHHESCEPFPESTRPRGKRCKRQRFSKMWHRIAEEKSLAMPISGRAPTTAELVDVLRGLRLRHYRTQSAILESCILALPYPEASVSLRQMRDSCSVEKALGRHLRICQGLSKLSRLICLNQIISIMLRNISASTY
jgi:hypothetical protein